MPETFDAEVIVVGAGPVGLLTASELQRRGVQVLLLEQRSDPAPGSRAIGVHSPVLSALETSGLTAALLDQARRIGYAEARSAGRLIGQVHFSKISSRFPFVATLPQATTETVFSQTSPTPRGDRKVTGLHVDQHNARAVTADQEFRAALVVLAGGSRTRHLFGTPEAPHQYPDRYLMTDLDVPDHADSPTAVVHLERTGVVESFPLPGSRRRIVSYDPPGQSAAYEDCTQRMRHTLEQLGLDLTDEVTGFGVRRFVSSQMRRGRILMIGDAAHEVSPMGGQGMNLGLLDAVSLAPLLAQWIRSGQAPDSELRVWESQRISSARWAAALAAMNTHLGRPASRLPHAARSAGVRLMLAPGAGRVFARAYSMGFDRHTVPGVSRTSAQTR